jgi:adenosylcobinamide-GDP ribazoletransferase
VGFWVALQFLTILPGLAKREFTARDFGRSLAYFPLIGLILGLILFGLHSGLRLILPLPVVSALVILALVVLTGAHHVDGLMDTFDGVIAGRSKEERLAIMSDTKVGTFGIVAAVLVILLKYVCLSSAPVFHSLILMPVLSRWAMVSAFFVFPAAKSAGMAATFKQNASWPGLVVATAIALIVSVLLIQEWGLVLMAALWLITFGIASYFNSRLGGLTGDNFGALNELSEILVLIIVILLSRLY